MIETQNSKIRILKFDIENLAKTFLNSDFYKSYLLSDSFAESLKLFLQAKYQISLNDEELQVARKLFMEEVAKIYESES